jgi:hypothetical protein
MCHDKNVIDHGKLSCLIFICFRIFSCLALHQELSAAAARHRALEERLAQFEAQAKESAAASSSSSSSSSSSAAAAASSLSSPSASVSQILAEEWLCCICRELLANAVMLACGHCFCEQVRHHDQHYQFQLSLKPAD